MKKKRKKTRTTGELYYSRLRRSFKEYLYKSDLQRQIFPDEEEDFYYCHVNLDWFEIRQTPPDLFSMAAETGYNLVGLGVAMNVWNQMQQSGQWTYFLPHYYWTFRCPDQYKTSQQTIFDNLSLLLGLIAEDLYMAGYYLAAAGGGLGVYIKLIMEQLSQINLAETQGVRILNQLYRSKEFSFIEYNLRDPVYGVMLFNNITQSNKNVNFSDDPDTFYDINQNIYNPQRFESWMKNYVTKIYDSTISDSVIYQENNIGSATTIADSLDVDQDGTNVITTRFGQNISLNREMSNMILYYSNKPKNSPNRDSTTQKQLIKGDDAMEQFFRAGSQFIIQPLITNYLYTIWLQDTDQTSELNTFTFQPNVITVDKQNEFIVYQKNEVNYGAIGSGLSAYLYTRLNSITERT